MKTNVELMNMAALLSDEITTVKVLFHGSSKHFTFLCRRELAAQFDTDKAEPCWAIADTIKGLQVVQVTNVDDEVTFDCMDAYIYRWVFAKVDLAQLDKLNDWQQDIVDKLSKAQRRNAQKQMLEAIGVDNIEVTAIEHKK